MSGLACCSVLYMDVSTVFQQVNAGPMPCRVSRALDCAPHMNGHYALKQRARNDHLYALPLSVVLGTAFVSSVPFITSQQTTTYAHKTRHRLYSVNLQ